MPFDPNKFLEETGGFDPDKFLNETQPVQPVVVKKPTYKELVQKDADELALKALESTKKDSGLFNRVVAPVKQFTGTMASEMNQTLPYRMIGKVIEPVGKWAAKNMTGTTEAIGNVVKAYDKNIPEPIKNTIGIVGDLSQMVPGVAAVEKTAIGIPKVVNKTASAYDKATGKILATATGIPEDALRMASTKNGRETLKAASGTEYDIGQNIVDKIDDAYNTIKSSPNVRDMLQNVPPVNVIPMVQKLRELAGNPTTSELKAISEKITKKADELTDLAIKNGQNGAIPAKDLYDFRKEIDQVIDDGFGKESGKYVTALKSVRYDIKNSLLDAAKNTDYAPVMQDIAKKLDAIDKMKSMIGKNVTTREGRAEGFVRNINGANKEQQRQWLEDFQSVFGGDYLNEAKNATMAKQIGEGGEAGWLPQHFNGKSLLGVAAGSALHTPLLGLASSSPKVATRVILPITQGIKNAAEWTNKKVSGKGTVSKTIESYPAWGSKGTGIDLKKAPVIDQKALPAPMLNDAPLIKKGMIPTKGERMRAIGESGAPKFDKPVAKFPALPSPEDIKKLYPRLSKENVRPMAARLNAVGEQMVGNLPKNMTEYDLQLAEKAKKFRVTPEQYKKIEEDILKGSKPSESIAVVKPVQERPSIAAYEAYKENVANGLEKKPVITIDDLRKKEQLRKMDEGKRIKKTGNKHGDIAAWHELGNRPTIGEVMLPKKPRGFGILGNDRGAVGSSSNEIKSLQKQLKDIEDSYEPLRRAGKFDTEEWESIGKRATEVRTKLKKLSGSLYGEKTIRNGLATVPPKKFNDSYETPYDVPKNVMDYALSQNIITSDANDAIRLSRIYDTQNEARLSGSNVKLYRAVEHGKGGIRPGDWVTTDRNYAIDHNNRYFDGKGSIEEVVVDGKDILESPTGNAEEAIYAPFELSGKNSKKKPQAISSTRNSDKFSKAINDIRGSSALKTMAASGAAALGGLTIGELLKRKQENKKK
jgi:hypothetical protein